MSTNVAPVIMIQEAEVAINNYLIVKAGTGAQQVNLTGADEKPFGVAQVQPTQMNAPGIGDNIEVAVMGGAQVKLGGNVSKGASIKSGALGVGLAAAGGDWAVGIADEAGSTNDIIGIRIFIHKA